MTSFGDNSFSEQESLESESVVSGDAFDVHDLVNEDAYKHYQNIYGLSDDLGHLVNNPEFCDVVFLVGAQRKPVYGVKAIMSTRSRVLHKLLYQPHCIPQTKKRSGSIGDIKNTLRMLKKRPSDPNIMQSLSGPPSPISKHVSFEFPPQQHNHQQVIIQDFEYGAFEKFIYYVHTGSVILEAKDILGLLNAADQYGMEDLAQACLDYIPACITVNSVCGLLCSAEHYIQYKCSKVLVQKALEFVARNGQSVLSTQDFALLPDHVVELVLSREDLQCDEATKFRAILSWNKQQCAKNPGSSLQDKMKHFIPYVEFHKIPATILMREIKPSQVVPEHILMTALAYQADPQSVGVDDLPSRRRGSSRSNTSHSSIQDSLPVGSVINI